MTPQRRMAVLPPTYEDNNAPIDVGVTDPQYDNSSRLERGIYEPVESSLSTTEAFAYSWRYDSAVNALANALARPNKYDSNYVASGRRDAMLMELQYQYKGKLNQSMVDTAKEITSQEEEDWFRETVHNKMLVEQAWDDHPVASLAGNLVSPENFAIGWAGSLAKAAKVTPKLLGWLDKAIHSSGVQTALYSSGIALAGGLQAVPGVLWNYDDPIAIPISMAIGGAIGVGMASGVAPSKMLNTIADTPADKSSMKRNGIFGVRMEAFLSKADELDSLQEGLGSTLLGNAGRGIRNDIDSVASRQKAFTSQVEINLANLEQAIKELGITNQSATENFRQALGGETTATRLDKAKLSLSMQRAMAFVSTTYNYNRSVALQKEVQDDLLAKINAVEKQLANYMDSEKTIAGTLPELARRYNEVNKLLYDYKSVETGSLAGMSKVQTPAYYYLPTSVVTKLAPPDINQLTELERGIVNALRNSGVAEKLADIVNTQGYNMRKVAKDPNYFHTRFDLNKVDEAALLISEQLEATLRKQAGAAQQRITQLEGQIKNYNAFLANTDADYQSLKSSLDIMDVKDPNYGAQAKAVNRVKLKYAKLKEERNKLYKEKDAQQKLLDDVTKADDNNSKEFFIKEAYGRILDMVGRQMHACLKASGVMTVPTTRQIGALILGNMLPAVGHQTLRDALSEVDMRNAENFVAEILAIGGDFNLTNSFNAMFGIKDMIKAATGAHNVDMPKLIGEASAFKSRFLWDYFDVDKETGLSLYRLLNDDLLNTVNRNIQEECGRVALSSASMKDKYGDVFYLNDPINIAKAQSLIRDLAKEKDFGDSAAEDLATLTFDALLGRATGETLSPAWQTFTQLAQAIQLKNSGIYNITETATTAHLFGTLAMLDKFIPAIKMGIKTDTIRKKDIKDLKDMVGAMFAMEARIRPDVAILSDDMTDAAKGNVARGILNSAQYMRWINGQAPVAQWQANMNAWLYQDALEKALRDHDMSMIERAGHTFTEEEFDSMRKLYAKHGMAVEKWEDKVLSQKAIRNCFDVVTNTSLQVRRGDKPRFLDSTLGKVSFAYQSFVWASHNKLLRRFRADYGNISAAMFIARQLPLAALMAIAVQALNGKDPFEDQEALANSIINSWSALGLLSYAGSVYTAGIAGTAPAFSALNTYMRGTESLVTQGDPMTILKNIPLLGGFLPYRIAIAALCGTLE